MIISSQIPRSTDLSSHDVQFFNTIIADHEVDPRPFHSSCFTMSLGALQALQHLRRAAERIGGAQGKCKK